jgi:hypothetical protein
MTIPVLADAARIVAAWNRLRDLPIAPNTCTADLRRRQSHNAATAVRMKKAAVKANLTDEFGTDHQSLRSVALTQLGNEIRTRLPTPFDDSLYENEP